MRDGTHIDLDGCWGDESDVDSDDILVACFLRCSATYHAYAEGRLTTVSSRRDMH